MADMHVQKVVVSAPQKPEAPQPKPLAAPPVHEQKAPEQRPQNNDPGHVITGGADPKTQFLVTQGIQNKPGAANAGSATPISSDAANQLANSAKIDIPSSDPKYGQVKSALQGIANTPDGNKLLTEAVKNNLSVKLGEMPGAAAYTQGKDITLGNASFQQGPGYLAEVLGHELTHQVSPNDGDSQNEEALASTLGRRIRAGVEGKPLPTAAQEAADYKQGVDHAKGTGAYQNLPDNTNIFDTLNGLGINFDPSVRAATGDTSTSSGTPNPVVVPNGNNPPVIRRGNLQQHQVVMPSGGNPPSASGGEIPPPSDGNPSSSGNGVVPPPSSAGSSAPPANASAEQQEFLKLINDFRAQNGLGPVKLNDILDKTAEDYSKALSDSGQFTHELSGTQFGDRMKQHGYNMSTGTENIAKGQQSVQDAFNGWVNSPGHRANLLNPNVTEIGLGHVGDVWTQEGGAPA